VHSNAELVDSEGNHLSRRLFDALLVTEKEREQVAAGLAYRAYLKRNLVTGAACACRVDALRLALPLSPQWIHDEWIALTCGLASKVKMLEEPLMDYRLHSSNTVGLPVPTAAWRVRSVLRAVVEPQVGVQQRRLDRLLEMRVHAVRLRASDDALESLDSAIRHARHRANLPSSFVRRLAAAYKERHSGRYDQWSSGDLSLVHDILIAT
jgi:hypothetical protein